MFVESTNYYARAGARDAVLQQRKQVSELRKRLGLLEGLIFLKEDGPGPDVRWECRYPTRAEYEHDLAIRGKSADFSAAREQMHTLLERFERHLESLAD